MTIPSAARRTAAPESLTVPFSTADLFLRLPKDAFTLNGFRAWVLSDEFPEKLRVTFVDQEIYLDMTKEELQTHAIVKAEISRVLLDLTRRQKLGQFFLDGVLVSNEAADVSNNPDAVLVKWDSLEKGRVRLVSGGRQPGHFMEIEGTPDWVLEVVSKSSIQKDTEKLRRAYHRAGIPAYWLVDARGEEIMFQILAWRKTGYTQAQSRGGWQRSAIFRHAFRLTRETVRSGLWQYTLLTKSK
jgi:Uma2 family endonuclease